MRIYQEGFELDAAFITENGSTSFLPVSRWIEVGGQAFFVSTNTFDVHTNPNGDGGVRALAMGGFNPAADDRHAHSPGMPFDLRYAWIGFAARSPISAPPNLDFGFSHLAGGITKQSKHMEIQIDFAGIVSIWIDGSEVATSTVPLTPSYHWYAVEYFLDDTNGFINIWVDDNLHLTYSGNTRNPDPAFLNYWDCMQVGFGINSSVDDIVVNAATISYTGGTSTPTIGATVSGGTSGAQAVITNFLEPITPGEGFLVLEPVGATAPSGFQLTETLSDGFGWSATSAQIEIDANGLDKNSGRPPENFILLLRPTADVSADFVGQDGNSVDNFLNVNDDPFGDTSDYNEGGVSGERDIYQIENLPFSPESIEALEVVSYSTRAGVITGVEHGVDPGSGITYGETDPVGSGGTYARGNHIFDVNPDTNAEWTEGEVNATDIAVRLD